MERLEFKFITEGGVVQTVLVEDPKIVDIYLGRKVKTYIESYKEDFEVYSYELWSWLPGWTRAILNNFGTIFKLIGISEPITVNIKNWNEDIGGFCDHEFFHHIGFECFLGERKIFDFERKCCFSQVQPCTVKTGTSTIEFMTTDYESSNHGYILKHYGGNDSFNEGLVRYSKVTDGFSLEIEYDRDAGYSGALMDSYLNSLQIGTITTSSELKGQILEIYNRIFQFTSRYDNGSNFKLSIGTFTKASPFKRNFTCDIECKDGKLSSLNISMGSNEKTKISLVGESDVFEYTDEVYYIPNNYDRIYNNILGRGLLRMKSDEFSFEPYSVGEDAPTYPTEEDIAKMKKEAYSCVQEWLSFRNGLRCSPSRVGFGRK